ncbi:nuclear transport factor 2 family protein [Paenibacillus frigoriresistens]|uniref:YybH family protein n=1 Tax=Paenibacillus alginolyticus TaxID=59839 RepID=UPI0015649772|nr:nuclear transport factor 2 family protein [Paenibacillus frigoriresistens]NRF94558.1 nuclear transport factor 2 family protein [Paenibacillus frigoriresistens]
MGYIEAFEKYIQATNTHDFNNVKSILDNNAVYWFADKYFTSISEIQNYFENTWNVVKNEVYTVTNVQWIAVDSNSATCIYTYHWEGYHEGKFVSGEGRATNLFIKNSHGDWKIVHEHLNSN